MRRKIYWYALIIAVYALISCISFKYYYGIDGFVGVRHDWAIPPLPGQIHHKFLLSFFTWNDIESIPLTLYHTRLYYGMFEYFLAALVNYKGETLSKIIVPVMMFIAAVSASYLSRSLGFSLRSSFVMGLIYMLNPVFYNRVIAGHHLYIFAYSLAPLFLAFLSKFSKNEDLKYLILSSLVLGISSVQIQFPIMLFIVAMVYMILYFVVYQKLVLSQALLKITKTFIIMTVIFFLLNSFWILELLYSVTKSPPFHSTTALAPLDYHEIIHAPNTMSTFLMIGYNHVYDPLYLWKHGHLHTTTMVSLAVVIFLSLSTILFVNKKYYKFIVMYSLALLILGVFLVSATNGPFPQLWKVLYLNISILKAFRETYHASFLIIISYSILIGVFIEQVSKVKQIRHHILVAIVVLLILLSGFPTLNSFMHKIQVFKYKGDDLTLYNFLEKDNDYYRVVYIPSFCPIKYPGLGHPSIDIMIKYSPKPTFTQHIRRIQPLEALNQYYTLCSIGTPMKLNYLHDIFSRIGVKFIICRTKYTSMYPYYVPMLKYLKTIYDNISLYMHWFNTSLICRSILKNTDKYVRVIEINNSTVLLELNSKPFVYPCNNIFVVSSFNEFLSTIPYLDETSCILILDYGLPNLYKLLYETSTTIYFITSSNGLDDLILAIASTLNGTQIVRPLSLYSRIEKHWSSTILSWFIHPAVTLSLLQGDVVLTYAMNASLDIEFNVNTAGKYKVFARVLNSKVGGMLEFIIDNSSKVTINTANHSEKFVWYEIGTYNLNTGTHYLHVRNIKGLNAIELILVVPLNVYYKASTLVRKMISEDKIRVIYVMEAERDFDVVSDMDSVAHIYSREASNGEYLSLKCHGYLVKRFEVPTDGYYMFALKIKGAAQITIDDRVYVLKSRLPKTLYLGPIYLEKGVHYLKIEPISRLIDKWDFKNETQVDEWRKYTPQIQFSALQRLMYDQTEKALKVMLYNSTRGWKTIRSPLILVQKGRLYRFIFEVKGINAYGVHAYIREYNANKSLIKEAFSYYPHIGSGTFEWKKVIIDHEPKGKETKYLQLQIWHGHLTNETLPNIVYIRNVKVYEYEPLYIDNVWFYSVNGIQNNISVKDLFSRDKFSTHNITIYYEKINPTLWLIKTNSRKPFLLIFAEGYDPRWIAEVYGSKGDLVEKLRPIPVYGTINGFYIDVTGNLTIIIKYEPQTPFEIGLYASYATFILCTLYIFISYTGIPSRYKILELACKLIKNSQ